MRSAMRLASLTGPTPCCLVSPKSDSMGSELIGKAHLIETKPFSRLELMLEIAGKFLAHTDRCHGVQEGFALRQGVVREPVSLENLLARQKRHGIVSQLADQGTTGGQVVKASAQFRQYRACLGTPCW